MSNRLSSKCYCTVSPPIYTFFHLKCFFSWMKIFHLMIINAYKLSNSCSTAGIITTRRKWEIHCMLWHCMTTKPKNIFMYRIFFRDTSIHVTTSRWSATDKNFADMTEIIHYAKVWWQETDNKDTEAMDILH